MRRTVVLMAVAAVCLFVSCSSEPSAPTLQEHIGTVDFGEPALVPGLRLENKPACGGVRRSFTSWIEIYLVPGRGAAPHPESENILLTVRGGLEGVPLQARVDEGPWQLLEPEGPRAQTLAFDVSLDGLHAVPLQIRRVGPHQRQPVCVTAFDVEFRGQTLRGMERQDRQVAVFLRDGAFGPGRLRWSGLLTVGPVEGIPLSLGSCGDCEFITTVANLGKQPAEAAVRSGNQEVRVTVGPRASERIRLPASRGRVALETTAEGKFLWAEPRKVMAQNDAPDVLLLTLDTTRRDHVEWYAEEPYAESLYGDAAKSLPRTPRLAELAEGATVFHNAVATAPWTLPSHTSMLTGLYPAEHRVGVNRDAVRREQTNLLTDLRERGYFLVGVACGPMVSSSFGFARFFDRIVNPPAGGCDAADANRSAFAALEEAEGAPIALMMNYFDPHYPYAPPADEAEVFGVEERKARVQDPRTQDMVANLPRGSSGWNRVASSPSDLPQVDDDWMRSAYRAEVLSMDTAIGALVDAWDAAGRLDDAIVVVVADHGEYLGERNFYSHAHRLEPELMRIPMMIRWSGLEPGDRYDTVSQIDVAATLAAALDLPAPGGSSIDLRSEADAGRMVLMEEHEARVHPLFAGMRLGAHTVGGLRGDRFFMEWEGGSLCGRMREDGWTEEECDENFGSGRLLSRVTAKLEADRKTAADRVIDENTENLLRSIGYIE